MALYPAELTILNFETGNLKCTIAGLDKTTGCLASRKTFLKGRVGRPNRKRAQLNCRNVVLT